MEYVQPVGGLANDPYLNANPVGGIEGSPVPAEAIEHPMRELVALIADAGLAPTDASLTQVAEAVRTLMQKQAASISVAGGTADAITAAYTPAIAALINGMTLQVRAASANVTATPTFTPSSPAIAAKTIVKGNNLPLVAGDIAGAGHWVELRYDATLDKWVVANPAAGVSVRRQIQAITASVSANALTVGLNPALLDFRSALLSNGVPTTRAIGAALSLVVPFGATLGTVAATPAHLVLLAIDYAGAVELAIVNLAGGNNLDETTLISTTSISAGATAGNVVYSTTARASVPFRVVGLIGITEAIAGTWATAPTTTQGQGGQALAALASIGYGQAWQAVTRIPSVMYYNTTGKPISVNVTVTSSANNTIGRVTVSINAGPAITIVVSGGTAVNQSLSSGNIIIPPGASYVFTHSNIAAGYDYLELR